MFNSLGIYYFEAWNEESPATKTVEPFHWRTKQMADTNQNEIDQLKQKSWDILICHLKDCRL